MPAPGLRSLTLMAEEKVDDRDEQVSFIHAVDEAVTRGGAGADSALVRDPGEPNDVGLARTRRVTDAYGQA